MHKIALFIFLAAGCCANTFASAAITVSAPFNSDFSNILQNPVENFIETNTGEWNLVSSKYRNVIPANTTSTTMLDFGNLGNTYKTDFLLSSSFRFSGSVSNSGTNSIGFAALGSATDATTNTSPFYLADVYLGGLITNGSAPLNTPMNAQLRLKNITSGSELVNNFDLQTILQEGKLYFLKLAGEYSNAGDLKLTLSLNDEYNALPLGSTSATILKDDVLAGTNFGFRNRATGGSSSALTVDVESFNVTAIPEPSSIGFVATSLIAGYAIGRYIRRKFAQPTA